LLILNDFTNSGPFVQGTRSLNKDRI